MKNDTHHPREDEVTFGATRSLDSSSAGHLKHLRDLNDVGVAEGNPDIRGWGVRSMSGRKLGEIDDLLVDSGVMKVRYAELKLEHTVAEQVAKTEGQTDPRVEPSRYALVPIGLLRIDERHDVARLTARAAQLVGLPVHEADSPTRTDIGEPTLRDEAPFGVDVDRRDRALQADMDDQSYASRLFDERLCFGPRWRSDVRAGYLVRLNPGDRASPSSEPPGSRSR
jgi:hypothetical protein